MKQRNMRKRIIRIVVVTSLLILLAPGEYTYMVPGNSFDSVTVMSAEIEWIYKVVNGVKYKRAYNAKTHKWVTDWIEIKNP